MKVTLWPRCFNLPAGHFFTIDAETRQTLLLTVTLEQRCLLWQQSNSHAKPTGHNGTLDTEDSAQWDTGHGTLMIQPLSAEMATRTHNSKSQLDMIKINVQTHEHQYNYSYTHMYAYTCTYI